MGSREMQKKVEQLRAKLKAEGNYKMFPDQVNAKMNGQANPTPEPPEPTQEQTPKQ